MAQFDTYEAQSLIEKSIGYIVNDNREDLIELLRQNGVNVNDDVSNEDLIAMTYVGIARSNQFKRDFARYLDAEARDEENDNYVDEEFFNGDGKTKKDIKKERKDARKQSRKSETNPTGKSKAGLLMGQIGTGENIQAAINTGLGIVAQKLTSKADQKSIQDATQLAAAKSIQAQREAEAQDKKAQAGAATRKWVVPVVIGVVVVAAVVGFIIYTKRKKA